MTVSEHSLFRALLLIVGQLAGGCGGIAQNANANANADAPGQPSKVTTGSAGSASIDSQIPVGEDCPYPQWDCSWLAPLCSRDFSSDAAARGCFCNKSRPITADDCAADMSLFCLRLVGIHDPASASNATIQCSCARTPDSRDTQVVTASCLKLFPGETAETMFAAVPPAEIFGRNAHYFVPAEELRQLGFGCDCVP